MLAGLESSLLKSLSVYKTDAPHYKRNRLRAVAKQALKKLQSINSLERSPTWAFIRRQCNLTASEDSHRENKPCDIRRIKCDTNELLNKELVNLHRIQGADSPRALVSYCERVLSCSIYHGRFNSRPVVKLLYGRTF